jgi:glycosyltransferase involved in cell wall biosynthesis
MIDTHNLKSKTIYKKLKIKRNIQFNKKEIYKIIIILSLSELINLLGKKNIIKNRISVIIPTYNRAKSLNRSLTSVLNQTYNNIEIIIVDDCSTDNTTKIINKIKDYRIKFFKLKRNKGPGFARNFGIKKSKGEFIAFQDSDDIYHEAKLEKQIINIKRNNSDLDFCKICLHFNNSFKIIFPTIDQEKKIYKNGILDTLIYGNFISTQSILIKKYIIEKYLFDPNLPRLIDFDLILRIASKINFSYTQEVLVDLYRNNDSIGKSSSKLIKSKKILYNKKYDFNLTQNQIFIKTLNMTKRRI